MRVIASPEFLEIKRNRARLRRRTRGEQQAVHYFHQVDDPYSHLAVQKLDALKATCTVAFVPYLVSSPGPGFQGDDKRYIGWANRDAHSIAEFYNISLAHAQAGGRR